MKKIIKGWKHLPGIHCGSVSLRDVVNFYGIKMSEPMCFGLGSGLGFFYTVDEEMSPTRNIHVRGPDMEPNFFNNFNKNSGWNYDDDNGNALATLLNFLNNEIPVIIQTNIYYLDYYNSKTHFPGHVVVACGYDDVEEVVFLADTGFVELQSVPYKSLMDSRSSKVKPYPLSNNWMAVEASNKEFSIEVAIPGAIKKNAINMLNGAYSPRGQSGVDSIKRLASDIVNWPNAVDWRWCVRYSYQVIQKRGTCGAAFRWMYRDFIYEAKQYTENSKLSELAKKMDHIGRLWFGISNDFKEISELKLLGDSLEKISIRIDELYKEEKDFYIQASSLKL